MASLGSVSSCGGVRCSAGLCGTCMVSSPEGVTEGHGVQSYGQCESERTRMEDGLRVLLRKRRRLENMACVRVRVRMTQGGPGCGCVHGCMGAWLAGWLTGGCRGWLRRHVTLPPGSNSADRDGQGHRHRAAIPATTPQRAQRLSLAAPPRGLCLLPCPDIH